MQLRIKDVDFDRHMIIVREAKDNKDRVVILPRALAPALRQRLLHALRLGHDRQAQRAGQSVGRNGFRRMADRFVADSLISLLTGNHPVSTRGHTEPLPCSRS